MSPVARKTVLEQLKDLNGDIDQLAGCKELSAEAARCLALAWWFTEEAIREATGECSMVAGHKAGSRCESCRHFLGFEARAERIRRML